MLNTRAIIIAAGSATRWKNHLNTPKHLVPVDGEPILHRTVRLLRERGVSDIHVVGLDDGYKVDGTSLYIPTKNPAYHDIDKFLSSEALWNDSGRTITLFGDVFFTDDAMDLIVKDTKQSWTVYGRWGWSKVSGKNCSELFAHSFYPADIPKHREMLHYVIDCYDRGVIKRCIGWEHYRAMQGAREEQIGVHKKYKDFVQINDWTEDFDHPIDYDRFIENWEMARG